MLISFKDWFFDEVRQGSIAHPEVKKWLDSADKLKKVIEKLKSVLKDKVKKPEVKDKEKKPEVKKPEPKRVELQPEKPEVKKPEPKRVELQPKKPELKKPEIKAGNKKHIEKRDKNTNINKYKKED